MTKRLEYTKAHHLSTLHDELVAAGIRPSYLATRPGTVFGIEMDVADDQDEAAVAAVVMAHDRAAAQAAWDAARQAEAAEDSALDQRIADLDAATAALQGTPTANQVRLALLDVARATRLALRLERRRRGV